MVMAKRGWPAWRWRPDWRVLVIAAAIGSFVLVWWLVPPTLYRDARGSDDARLKAVTDTRTALLAGLVGLGALGTFWLNSRVYRITARTFEVTERGHLTDRYAKAIEQLGSVTLDVRLGGIYALEQIANDSPRERDQTTIVEVLSAFVRRHSREKFYEDQKPAGVKEDGSTPQPRREPPGPSTDVQAALTVLGRLPERPGITRARLRRAHLEHAWLPGANLKCADLTSVVRFDHANLREARLDHADLTGAHFDHADLTDACLDGANLTGAHFPNAVLSGVQFRKATLSAAHLSAAKQLTQAQIDTVEAVDDFTELPPDLHPPEPGTQRGWRSSRS
jgi:hypothetical protein